MPKWPTDEEVDANPDFWTAILMARGLFEPSGAGGTGKDLGYWYESAESAAPHTPLMRQWLAYLWNQIPDTKPRTREGRRNVSKRSEAEEAKRDLARRVMEGRLRENPGKSRVRLATTKKKIVKMYQEGGSRYPRTWLDEEGRLRDDVIDDVLRQLKNWPRLFQPSQ